MANIFTQLRSAVAGLFSGRKVSNTRFFPFGNKEVYSPVEQDKAISHGFNANSAVYSIVKKYAKKAASIERYLENKKDDSEIDKGALVDLLQRPNENQSHFALFKNIYSYYKICGEAFLWLNRGDVTQMVDAQGNLIDRTPKEYLSQPIVEMYSIPPNEIVVVVDPNDPNNILGYFLRSDQTVRFRKEDIIHWKDINLEWDELSRPQTRGMTPLKPGSKTLAADNSFLESMLRMAQNDGAKGAIYNKTVGATMSPKQQEQVDSVIKDKVNNKEIKNAIAAFEGDWGYLDFGLTAVDMDTLNAREFIYKELCFLLDVPYGFFDSHTPYAEKQLAARDWISNSIKPDVKELDAELNRMLLPAFGLDPASVEICSDFDALPELQDDKVKQVEWLTKAPLTPNEIREALEYEPISDPIMDEVFMPTGSSSIMSDPNMPTDAAGNPIDLTNPLSVQNNQQNGYAKRNINAGNAQG